MYGHEVIDAIIGGRLRLMDARGGTFSVFAQRPLFESAAQDIRESIHFHFGDLEMWDDQNLRETAVEFARGDRLLLPFPPVWVDGRTSWVAAGSKAGALLDYDADGSIVGLLFFYDGRAWGSTGMRVRLDRDGETFRVDTDVPEGESFNRDLNIKSDARCFWTFLSAVAALSASGVKRQAVTPPPKLNRRLLMRGKEPRYTYHVLVVDVPGHEPRQLGALGMERLGPRLHWVRGHLRHRPGEPESAPKTVVVRPALRGSAQRGSAAKDYRVRPNPEGIAAP